MPLPPPITSRSNARVKALRAADGAQPGELIAIEGENLIREAHRSGLRFDTLFLREGAEAPFDLPTTNIAVVSRDVFASAVDTASPQGIAALVVIPDVAAPSLSNHGVVLVIESLQDPGNLGTLIRSAEAFGIPHVFTTPDTVSRWNPKTIRASAGSAFRIPVTRAPLSEIKSLLHDYRFLAAVAQQQGATPTTEASLLAPCALLIGNEGAGLSASALALADARIHIPCAVESLNAAIAGSTLMYEALRQRLRQHAEGTA